MRPSRPSLEPSLARAASGYRQAHAQLAARDRRRDSAVQHHARLLALRDALHVYIVVLERHDLPVANRLREELRLLSIVDGRWRFGDHRGQENIGD